VNNEQLTALEKDEKDLKKQINELRGVESDPEQEALTIEQFLNLSKNVSNNF